MIDNINNIIMLLCKGMANRKLYFSDHPRVNSYGSEIIDLANDHFRSTGSSELFIGIVDGFFIFDGKRVFGPSVTGKQLIQFAERLYSGGFALQKGIKIGDLQKFFDITANRGVPVKTIAEARTLFTNSGIKNIRIAEPFSDQVGNIKRDTAKAWEGQAVSKGLPSPTFLYQELYDVVSNAYGDAAFDRTIDIDKARSVSEFMLRYIQSSFADVMQHVHYADYDSYTVGHSVRVASLAVYVGSAMQWSKKDLLAIGSAALLHDIGKSRIPDEILLKKGKLTDEEFAVIRDHPRAGAEILSEQKDVSDLDLAACWGHHIRYDGGGYPRQPGWAVRHPVTALLQICDVFEALTAVRPYKEALDPRGAYTIMLADRGGFHPGLLAAFISMVGMYPPGTYVRLSDRRVGMVTEVGEHIDRPKVLITASKIGEPLDENDRYMVDLTELQSQSLSVDRLLLNFIG
ncbi:HD-GYP domain-containing protein [Desulfopila sp. IMCC35006]|uniref:HD-GYP domain-containing protein n=1 Tax=Desulfopila sp. IMCC35006 TaxID=2569542 RepID=UPI00142EC57A|nr:HD-GYP domain-containing protein [Desulfopila sp. IMCC35006]